MASIAKQKVIGNGQKRCKGKCGKIRPYSEFYVRPTFGTAENPAVEDGHFVSECITCMRERGKTAKLLPPWESRVKTEQLAIAAFQRAGIWAQTGKATSAPDVDVVLRGMVWCEVKHATPKRKGHQESFTFVMTQRQQQRGFLAHVVMLICEYPDGSFTYHLFHADNPVFLKTDGTLKSAVTYVPGKTEQTTRGRGGVQQIVQADMDEAENRWELIDQWQKWIEGDLCEGERPTYGKPFAR